MAEIETLMPVGANQGPEISTGAQTVARPVVATEQKLSPQAQAYIEETLKNAKAVPLGQEIKVGPLVATARAEAPPTASQPESAQRHRFTEKQVVAYAALADEPRLQTAQELLGIQLTLPQKEAILAAHLVGEGELGKDDTPAAVYNYRLDQLLRKAEILKKAGFNEEQRSLLLEAGIVGLGIGVPDYVKEAAEKKKKMAYGAYEMMEHAQSLANLSDSELGELFGKDPEGKVDRVQLYKELLAQSRIHVEKTLNPEDPKDQKELEMVLHYVRDDICRTYEAVRLRPAAKVDTSEEWYHPPPTTKTLQERIKIVEEMLGDYDERFWEYGEPTLKKVFEDKAKNITVLQDKYQGAARYVARRVAAAIIKELNGGLVKAAAIDDSGQIDRTKIKPTEAEIGDYYLLKAKQYWDNMTESEREARRKERRRATAFERLHYNDWRERFDFKWAETAEELDDSLEDWLDFFQQALPSEAEDKVYEYVTTGTRNVISALHNAYDRINIPFNSEIAHRLEEKAHGHIDTIAGAVLLESKSGFDYFIKLRKDFANNYEGHYNRIYLSAGFARTARAISKNNGALYKGGPEGINKPLAGDTLTHRGGIAEEIIEDSRTHELYVTSTDIKQAVKGNEEEIKKEVKGALQMLQQKLAAKSKPISKEDGERIVWAGLPEVAEKMVNARLKEGMGRYGWDDAIEELMLEDKRGWKKARAIAPNDPNNADRKAAEERVKTRTELFRKMKRDMDKADVETIVINGRQVKVCLADLNEEQRKVVIRQRIETKMASKQEDKALRDEIKAMTEEEAHQQGFATVQAAIDHALWKWVKDYNSKFLDVRQKEIIGEAFFPSIWDRERLLIRDAEDLIDRTLEDNEFDAMYEEVDDGYKDLTDKQMQLKIEAEITQKRLALAATGKTISDEDVKQLINEKVEDVRFEGKQRRDRAVRNYNLNVAQDKFLGLEARYGGLTTRVIDKKTGKTKLVTIYELAEEILKAKIDKEEAEVEAKVEKWAMARAAAGATLAQIEAQKVKQRRLFRRHCVFAAVLGLRELKIAKDLPLYNLSYYSDVSQIGAFAPLVGYTDDEKEKLLPILERPRREAQAVFSFLAAIHMDGKMLKVKDEEEGLFVEDEEGKQEPAHEESFVRPRVINEGGVLKLRDIFEAAFMISTSGGVKVPDLIAKMAWLGVYDELYENGCKDKLQWQSFRRRRSKWELREQNFFNTREWTDPLTYVERLEGAAKAKKFLVGGEIQGQGDQPGVFNETMKGAWRMRRAFLQSRAWVVGEALKILGRSKTIADIEDIKKELREVLEQKEQARQLTPTGRDELVEVAGDVISFLRLYLKSRDYQLNKGGHASKNWHYDNELIAQAYLQELMKREPIVAKRHQFLGWDENGKEILAEGGEILNIEEGEALGGQGQAFAVQGRSQLARDTYEGLLRGSTYEIPDEDFHAVLSIQARQAKKKLDDKKQEFLNELLSPVAKTVIKATGKELKKQNWTVRQFERKFAGVFAADIDEVKLMKYRKKLAENPDPEPEEKEKIVLEIDRTMHRLNRGQIDQYRKDLKKATDTRTALELQINKTFNQAVQAKLEEEVAHNNFTWQPLLEEMKSRRAYLTGQNTKDAHLEWEISRLTNYYLDTEVHKEVVGEWGAVLAGGMGEWEELLAA